MWPWVLGRRRELLGRGGRKEKSKATDDMPKITKRLLKPNSIMIKVHQIKYKVCVGEEGVGEEGVGEEGVGEEDVGEEGVGEEGVAVEGKEKRKMM